MDHLFRRGAFVLHSGATSTFKIDCDALTDDDLDALAGVLCRILPLFQAVEGVPTGGLRIAAALRRFACPHARIPLLIVDDVLTTGASMEAQRAGRSAIGAVLFSRASDCPAWITPLFSLNRKACF